MIDSSLRTVVSIARAPALRGWVLLLGLLGLADVACVYDWPTSRIPRDAQPPGCGNLVVNPPEECDGEDLSGESCVSLGWAGGELGCTDGCTFDTTACLSNAVCGDGIVAPDEPCDDGDVAPGDGCDDGCAVEPGWACSGEPSVCTDGCGNGVCHVGGGEDRQSCPDDCGWRSLATGLQHTCGLKGDGSVWCWGGNADGQLGDGTTEGRAAPRRVEGLPGVVALATGDAHTCAVDFAGHGWCWGANDQGQLGDGTIVPSAAPVLVVGLTEAVTIATGARHSCATTSTLQALCWGGNADGQLGDGTTFDRQSATEVAVGAGLTSARAITAGADHTCALAGDDTLWCWGDNGRGQLGTGDLEPSLLPLPVDPSTGLLTATLVDAGALHTCAVDGDGQAWCWGEGSERRLGNGSTLDERSPNAVIDVVGTATLSAGGEHTCAVTLEGALWCWGRGLAGQLGTGSPTQRADPTELPGLTTGQLVRAGGEHTCATTTDALAWCWGSNDVGQLGDATAVGSATPLEVTDPY